MESLVKLKLVRARIKGQLTRCASTIDDNTTVSEAKIRLKKIRRDMECIRK